MEELWPDPARWLRALLCSPMRRVSGMLMVSPAPAFQSALCFLPKDQTVLKCSLQGWRGWYEALKGLVEGKKKKKKKEKKQGSGI